MTSDRLYRPRISVDAAPEQLTRHAGTQFDATIVEMFCDNITLRQGSPGEPDLDTITTSTAPQSAAYIKGSPVVPRDSNRLSAPSVGAQPKPLIAAGAHRGAAAGESGG
jgi:hypothetical protein